MKYQVIPAINDATEKTVRKKIFLIQDHTPWISIDVMDGKFVDNTTWFDANVIAKWKIKPLVELDLMVNDPESVIRRWLKVKTFKRAIWHIELPIDHQQLIDLCHRWKLEAGLSVSPKTPVTKLIPFLKKIDCALVYGVEPGWSGQKLIPSTLTKVRALRKLAPKIPIEYDGGITVRNISRLKKYGVNRFCVTSAIFKHKKPLEEFWKLKKLITTR